ncbi:MULTISPECIES: hypothetical protein [Streptomyces]|uniref:Uncharacterized protein n=1 Tax=Streptomyces koyangensis TaxID=188770 RepID=A0A385DH87_9ACTN|nr:MULTISPECIES: hypothetical protein [Streptomyces]AXQ57646.1 hypothetical protein D0C37_25625 [Streptomyces koyangensis]MDH6191845.1 hypothetical protein [Streptomyces sp. CZ24]PKR45940.1 hypothetical protein CWE27_06465 [Streptomyces sp. EAG2]
MPSVVGLLEERERGARQRGEVLREEAGRVLAELRDAELFWERFVTAREVLAGPGDGADVEERAVPVGENAAPTPAPTPAPASASASTLKGGRAAGSVVPVRGEGVQVSVLSPEYQRIVGVLAASPVALACGEIASALGLERVSAKVEGVRSKAARLAERGWLVKEPSGRFTRVPGLRGGGS